MSEATKTKPYSKAELAHLKEKATAANVAIQAHQEFVQFLREQHDAPEAEGWQLGPKGFVLTPSPSGAEGSQEPPSGASAGGKQEPAE